MSEYLFSPKKNSEIDTLCTTLLKEKGLSITAPRKLILSLLLREHGPFSAETILKKLPPHSCDQATIYRCLNQFAETELVTTTFIERDLAHFEYNDPLAHHHHVICKICKKIDSFKECLMDKIEKGLVKKGYADIQHRLEIFAVCKDCQ
jgi:Fe2+ or Zn2+ uptake regulation protein